MKEFKTKGEMPEWMVAYMEDTLEEALPGDFSTGLGGSLYLLEVPADLQAIQFQGSGGVGTSLNRTAKAFDVCEYITIESSFDGVMIFDLYSNSGGPTYFIPSDLVTPVVRQCVALTNPALAVEETPPAPVEDTVVLDETVNFQVDSGES